ncbi:hypothetical protein ACHAWF_010222 [Thalassiosira exigua]
MRRFLSKLFGGGPQDGIRPFKKEAVPVYLTSELNWLVRFTSYAFPLVLPLSSMTECPAVVEWEDDMKAEEALLCLEPARKSLVRFDSYVLPLFEEETISIARPEGGDPLEVKLFRKQNSPKDTKAPLILYLHAGGFTVRAAPLPMGATLFTKLLNLDDENTRVMEGATWATVYYRLAPENIYPAAAEDSLLALNHLVHKMGLGGGGIHVIGISAGGTLAMETTMKSLDLVDSFVVDEPMVPLQTLDGNKWSMDSPSFRRYSYTNQVPVTWLDWSFKAYTGTAAAPEDTKDLCIGATPSSVDITGGSMNVSEWVKRSTSVSLPQLILVTAKGDPLQDGGLAFKNVYEQVVQAIEAKNSSATDGGNSRIKHFDTSSGHTGLYLYEPGVLHNIVKEWYVHIRRAYERKNDINIEQ